MNLYLSKIQKCCELLLKASRRTVAELPLRALEMADYKVGHKAPEGEYLPFACVDGLDKRYWIKTEVKTPIAGENESLYFEMVTGASGWDATNPQIIVYINGEMLAKESYPTGNELTIIFDGKENEKAEIRILIFAEENYHGCGLSKFVSLKGITQ